MSALARNKAALESPESGQTTVLLVLVLGLFLLSGLGFAVDFTNIWFQRQAAQSAADAACLAGASDLLFTANGGSLPASAGFTTPALAATTTGSDCKTTSGATMCWYASHNGFSGTGIDGTTHLGNSVSWTFPTTASGATTLPASLNVKHQFINVVVQENAQTWFMGLLGIKYQSVGAHCTCGLTAVKTAPPILILDPTDSSTFTINNNAGISIYGGASRSIEADSTSTSTQSGGGTIDLSHAGPNNNGADIAVVGSQTSLVANVTYGVGSYQSPTLPIPDPYGNVPAPSVPATKDPATASVAYHDATYYCPETAGCTVYFPGHYTKKISVGTGTALFANGLYYMDADLDASGTGATMRMAYPGNSATSQVDGVTFYFNSGVPKLTGSPNTSTSSKNPVDALNSHLMDCTIGGALPPGVASTIEGTALWGPCMTSGTYNGNAGDTLSSSGTRGLVMMWAHGNTSNPGPDLEGQGSMAFAGALYFHNTASNLNLKLAGGSGSTTDIIGYIVADQLTITGQGTINMALNPLKVIEGVKVAMFQ